MSADVQIDMLDFWGAIVDVELDALRAATDPIFAEMLGGMAEIAREHLDAAQAQVDALVAEDDTWREA